MNVCKKSWVVMKYIENPLLIFNRKFDIRVWVVVASWNPFRVYWYKNCYVRFSGKDYDAKNIGNQFIHLTSNAINSKMLKIGDDKNFDKLPENMWYLSQLQEFLNEKYHGTGSPSRKKCNETQFMDSPPKKSSTKVSNETTEANTPSGDIWTEKLEQ